MLRRWVGPAAAKLQLPTVSWLTFRRTYSSWAHDKGVPGKVIAALMGHARVDTTLNVYAQVLDDSLRAAADKVGRGLFTIVHKQKRAGELERFLLVRSTASWYSCSKGGPHGAVFVGPTETGVAGVGSVE